MFSTYTILLWYLILILVSVMIIAIISTSVSNVSSLWAWWGFGVACLSGALFIFLIMNAYFSKKKKREVQIQQSNDKYKTLAKQAQTDPNCVSERQKCYNEKIQLKRQKEKMGTNTEKEDQAAINACAKKSATNVCIENVLNACEVAITARKDAGISEQFKNFRNTHEAPEVLGFCKTATL